VCSDRPTSRGQLARLLFSEADDPLLDAGDPGAVVATFQIDGVGLPQEVVADIRRSPMWAQLEAMAQSAAYNAVITTDLQRVRSCCSVDTRAYPTRSSLIHLR
jgi:hypothetical protein